MTSRVARAALAGAVLAPMGVIASVAIALALRDGYDPMRYTLAGLGMQGAPHAVVFNLAAFLMPGVLLAIASPVLASRLARDGLGAAGRIALHMLTIAALAYAAQGVWRFDPQEPDGGASRWHAVAHGASQVAWLGATTLFVLAVARLRGWRVVASIAALALVVMLACIAWLPTAIGKPGLVQLIALAAFFGWPLAAGAAAMRAARRR